MLRGPFLTGPSFDPQQTPVWPERHRSGRRPFEAIHMSPAHAGLRLGAQVRGDIWPRDAYPKKGIAMRKLLALVAALVLAVGVMGGAHITAPKAEATGNCTTGYVTFYRDAGLAGGSRKFCYQTNDTNIESEACPSILCMGPLADGSYQDDFDSVASASGISSVYIYDNPNDSTVVNACLYYGPSYNTVLGWIDSGGYNISIAGNDAMGSFKFTANVSQLGC